MLTGSRNLFESIRFDGTNAKAVAEFAYPIAYIPEGYSNTSCKEGLVKRVYIAKQKDGTEVQRLTLKLNEYLVKSLKNNTLLILSSEAYDELLEDF